MVRFEGEQKHSFFDYLHTDMHCKISKTFSHLCSKWSQTKMERLKM